MDEDSGLVKALWNPSQRHDTTTHLRIHTLCKKVVDELFPTLNIFFVPTLVPSSSYPCIYEEVELHEPTDLHQYPQFLPEFCRIWKKMWYFGFALSEIKFYKQSDGRIALLDFSKTYFRQTNPELKSLFHRPAWCQNQRVTEGYFKDPSLTIWFLDELVGEGSEAEQYSRVAALPYHG